MDSDRVHRKLAEPAAHLLDAESPRAWAGGLSVCFGVDSVSQVRLQPSFFAIFSSSFICSFPCFALALLPSTRPPKYSP